MCCNNKVYCNIKRTFTNIENLTEIILPKTLLILYFMFLFKSMD